MSQEIITYNSTIYITYIYAFKSQYLTITQFSLLFVCIIAYEFDNLEHLNFFMRTSVMNQGSITYSFAIFSRIFLYLRSNFEKLCVFLGFLCALSHVFTIQLLGIMWVFLCVYQPMNLASQGIKKNSKKNYNDLCNELVEYYVQSDHFFHAYFSYLRANF